MFKHTATTLLGILIIIALGLTASGRIKDYEQVSDILPNSLAGSIMEAQIVVVKDFDLLAPPALGHRQLDTDYIPGADLHLHMARLETASKIPIWTGPIRPDCFDKKCDFGHFGNEYFAFMPAVINNDNFYPKDGSNKGCALSYITNETPEYGSLPNAVHTNQTYRAQA
ncbi:hypothetical protein BGZ58_001284 [Dissophora ornata]|nr:hypothetical protein BGZ58_001284 [Dissophora ornata]